MKKIIVSILSIFIILSLVACGHSELKDGAGSSIDTSIFMEETSFEHPAKVNQWVKTAMYNDGIYETIYVRITKVSSSEKDKDYIKSCLEENNNLAKADYEIIPESYIDDGMNIVDYEIFVPDDFPSYDDNGEVSLYKFFSLYPVNKNGENVSEYDLGSVIDMSKGVNYNEQEFQVGNTYALRGYYFNSNDEDYCFHDISYPEGKGYKTAEAIDVYYGIY